MHRILNKDFIGTVKLLYGLIVTGVAISAWTEEIPEIADSGDKAALLAVCAATMFLIDFAPSYRWASLPVKITGTLITFAAGYQWLQSETDSFATVVLVFLIGSGVAVILGLIPLAIWTPEQSTGESDEKDMDV